jgi:hypothetical protein
MDAEQFTELMAALEALQAAVNDCVWFLAAIAMASAFRVGQHWVTTFLRGTKSDNLF